MATWASAALQYLGWAGLFFFSGWAALPLAGRHPPLLRLGRQGVTRLGRLAPPPGGPLLLVPGWASVSRPAPFPGQASPPRPPFAPAGPVGQQTRLGRRHPLAGLLPAAPSRVSSPARPGWAGLGESGLAGIFPLGPLCQFRMGRIIVFRLGQAGTPLAQAGLSSY
jgi:hypothetical protein